MTAKERAWLAEYFTCWNASEAARRVGYKWPDKQGQEKKAKFINEIRQKIEELQMTADEVLIRLANEAKADISLFLYPGTLEIDIKKVHEFGYLVKSLVHTKYGPKIELYDAQAAKVHIGKHLGLFTDKVELSGNDDKPLTVKVIKGVSLDDL